MRLRFLSLLSFTSVVGRVFYKLEDAAIRAGIDFRFPALLRGFFIAVYVLAKVCFVKLRIIGVVAVAEFGRAPRVLVAHDVHKGFHALLVGHLLNVLAGLVDLDSVLVLSDKLIALPAVRKHRVLVAGVRLAVSAFLRRQAASCGSVPRLDFSRRVAVEGSRQSAVPRVSVNAVAQAEIIPHAVAVFFFQLVAPFVEAHPFRRIRLDLLPCVHVDFPARHRRRHGVQFFHATHKLGIVCLHLLILLAQPRAFASGFGVPAVISLFELSVPVFQICPGCEALSLLNGVLYLMSEGIQQCLRSVFQVAAQFNAVEPAVISAVLPALKRLEHYIHIFHVRIGGEQRRRIYQLAKRGVVGDGLCSLFHCFQC